MNTETITKLVRDAQVSLEPDYQELHEFFVTPEKVMSTTLNGKSIQVWIVFVKDEYRIVYSEQKTLFGLAFNNIVNELIYLGGYKTLQDAIEALLSKDEEV